jgi:Ni,Fe-hydrogenase I large subunit
MKTIEKIVNRIEGEAKLKIYKKYSKIDFVEIEFWQYRGIEGYLRGKNFMDALVINPRVCGICGHSHLLATALAIESALGVKPTQKAKILREITTGLEIVQNHYKWFWITLFPLVDKDKKYLLKAFELSSLASKAIAVIAGQFPHNSYIIPGGVTSDPTGVEILKVENILEELYAKTQEYLMDKNGNSKDMDKFFDKIDPNLGKGLNRFLVLGENLYFNPNGVVEKVTEEENSSLSKNVKYDGKYAEVGPLARNLNNESVKKAYEKYGDSIYSRIFARLYETIIVLEYLLEKIKEIDICSPSCNKFEIKDGKGTGVIEAPRGSLIHKIEIKDEKIKNYDIIVPTQFNLSSDSKENPSPAQAAMIGCRIDEYEAVFRCFDICSVCVTH